MAIEWNRVPFGELTENFDGSRVPVKEADRRPGPYPYYGASGVVDYVNDYLFEGEYLLVAEDGENLRTRATPIAFLARGRFWVNNHAHIVRGNAKADTRFLMYALAATDISGYLTGSAMPKLTQGHLSRIELSIPAVSEQRAIAHILGTLDDKIEVNRKMAATLESMARALFKSWFVDFDPVRQVRRGRFGLSAHLAALFPNRLTETEGEKIPEGWAFWRLGEIVALNKATIAPATEPDRLFEHYSIPAYDNRQEATLDLGATIKSNKTVVVDGAVLLSKLNPEIVRVWLPGLRREHPQVASTEFLCFAPRPPVGRAFIFTLFKSEPFRRELEAMVTGTSKSHQRVSPTALMQLAVCSGTAEVFRAFERQVWPLLERSLTTRKESNILLALRNAVLPKLVSGELRVKDAERFLVERGL